MKVSDAIRNGKLQLDRLGQKQIMGDYYRADEGACAVGMALLGAGTHPEILSMYDVDEVTELPALGDIIPRALLPAEYTALHPGGGDPALIQVLIDLNDPPVAMPVNQIISIVESLGR
jgi:hypothetical protein